MSPSVRSVLAIAVIGVTAVACGIGIRRDLSGVRIGRIGYEDMCELQAYFDAIEAGQSGAEGPRLVLSSAAGRGSASGGRDLWEFESSFAVSSFKRVLEQNWKGLPSEVRNARKLAIEVEWVDRAGIQRVVSGKPADLRARGQSWSLPYHPCLSDLLYGAPLYRQRRVTLGLPEAPHVEHAPVGLRADEPDGGAGESDGGTQN